MTLDEKNELVPVWKKALLTMDEAASYTGIGVNRLREMTLDENCDFVIYVGSRRMIKRKKFEEYLEGQYSI